MRSGVSRPSVHQLRCRRGGRGTHLVAEPIRKVRYATLLIEERPALISLIGPTSCGTFSELQKNMISAPCRVDLAL